MASFLYSVRTTKKSPNASVMVRINLWAYVNGKRVVAYAQSGIKVTKDRWDNKGQKIKDKFTVAGNMQNDGKLWDNAQKDLDEIKSRINTQFNMLDEKGKLSSEWLQGIVDEYWRIRGELERQEKRAIEEMTNRESLNEYIARYIQEISDGIRLTNKNTIYRIGSVKATKASMAQFCEFQKSIGSQFTFEDINLEFYQAYTGWLLSKGYTANSVGKCIKDMKNILANAQEEGLHNNEEYKRKRFKVTTEDSDNIYLTSKELVSIAKVDLSNKAKGYSDARDVFLAGCWLAQRVSDYNRLTPENIEVKREKTILNDEVVEVEKTYITLTQQKTGARVVIPATQQLRDILTKYNNRLPYIWEQKLNLYIKEIGRMAGIEQLVEITTTKGGRRATERIPKYKLIMSHTARRTGATLMYLAGMEIWDICRITGHTSVKTLRKYLKADELDVAGKMSKYDYFK